MNDIKYCIWVFIAIALYNYNTVYSDDYNYEKNIKPNNYPSFYNEPIFQSGELCTDNTNTYGNYGQIYNNYNGVLYNTAVQNDFKN